MFARLGNLYRHIKQTLEDGRYGSEHKSFWPGMADKAKDKLKEASKSWLAKYIPFLPFLGKLSTVRLLWTAAVAAISIENVVLGAFAVAGSAVSWYATEYFRCKRAKEQVITEQNFAGQTVRGRRADLNRLHKAQQKILTAAFNAVSGERDAAAIKAAVAEVEMHRQRVLVVQTGAVNADDGLYAFFEPAAKRPPVPKPAPEIPPPSPAGDGHEKVADYIVSLEQALPQPVLEKVRQRRTGQAVAVAQP